MSVVGKALGSVASVLTGALGLKPKTPKIPKTPVMPMADDLAVEAARKRSIAAIRSRSGRASTILSDDSNESLGG